MPKRFFALISVVLVVLVPNVLGGPIREGSLTGSSNGINIIIRWQSDDESGVRKVEIERQVGIDGQFISLHEIPLKGNYQSYEYIDDTAFRAAERVYRYRLKVSFSNGAPSVFYGPITVRHDVSSVRRTWGSIKAMFR